MSTAALRASTAGVTVIQALEDSRLLGAAIKDRKTFTAWWAALKAIFGLPMSDAEAEIFRACTGRAELPTAAFAVIWLVIGRRGAKSLMMAVIAVYQAIFKDWRRFLSPGERAVVLIVAADREQAKVIRRYVGGILATPMFARYIEAERDDAIELSGSVVIEVATCNYRTVRGRSVCVALLDEVCFWRSESTVNPDVEVWRAIRASMATFGKEAMAFIASSPYAKRGLLWDGYRRYFGKDDPLNLVWVAGTKVMNPTISDDFLKGEFEADPASAASEYDAEWRNDIAGFLDRELVESAVDRQVTVRPPCKGVRYRSGADPSGGRGDSFTLSIVHDEDNVAVVDCLVEIRSPFNPTAATEQMAETLKAYGLTSTTGDKYAAAWVTDAFQKCGIRYENSELDRSGVYLECLPLFTSGRVRLLDNHRLIHQFSSLERRTSPSGKDRVDHGVRGSDDASNAVAMALVTKGRQPLVFTPEILEKARQLTPYSRFHSDPSRYPAPSRFSRRY